MELGLTPSNSPVEAHLELLARCVDAIRPRAGIAYAGARVSDNRNSYELQFQKGKQTESVFVPLEMVSDAVISRDNKHLISRIDAQYMLLFPAK